MTDKDFFYFFLQSAYYINTFVRSGRLLIRKNSVPFVRPNYLKLFGNLGIYNMPYLGDKKGRRVYNNNFKSVVYQSLIIYAYLFC